MNPGAKTFDDYEAAFTRVMSGIGDEWDRITTANNITPEERRKIFGWFETNFPQRHQSLKECDDRITKLWLSEKPDAAAQKEFNEQLRIYRNGHLWMMEKFAAARKGAAREPKQGKLI